MVLPVTESQIRTVLSKLPLAIKMPSGEKATDMMLFVCPARFLMVVADATFQMRKILSSPPLAILLPSEEKATDLTELVCPLSESVVAPSPISIP